MEPRRGPAGTPFTIADAGARFQHGDIVYFYVHQGLPITGIAADNVSISADGRFAHGDVPSGLSIGLHHPAVGPGIGSPSRVIVPLFIVDE